MTDTAYYYPAPYWILRTVVGSSHFCCSSTTSQFFYRITCTVATLMQIQRLPSPLEDRGLLRVLEPGDWIDGEMTGKLAEVVTGLCCNFGGQRLVT